MLCNKITFTYGSSSEENYTYSSCESEFIILSQLLGNLPVNLSIHLLSFYL